MADMSVARPLTQSGKGVTSERIASRSHAVRSTIFPEAAPRVRLSSDYAKDLKEGDFMEFWNFYLSDLFGPALANHDDFLVSRYDTQIDTKTKLSRWSDIETDRLNPGKIHVNAFSIHRHLTRDCSLCQRHHRRIVLAFAFLDRSREGWFGVKLKAEFRLRPVHEMASYNQIDEKSSRQSVIYVGLEELKVLPDLFWSSDF